MLFKTDDKDEIGYLKDQKVLDTVLERVEEPVGKEEAGDGGQGEKAGRSVWGQPRRGGTMGLVRT